MTASAPFRTARDVWGWRRASGSRPSPAENSEGRRRQGSAKGGECRGLRQFLPAASTPCVRPLASGRCLDPILLLRRARRSRMPVPLAHQSGCFRQGIASPGPGAARADHADRLLREKSSARHIPGQGVMQASHGVASETPHDPVCQMLACIAGHAHLPPHGPRHAAPHTGPRGKCSRSPLPARVAPRR
jgi:hypothetical protein